MELLDIFPRIDNDQEEDQVSGNSKMEMLLLDIADPECEIFEDRRDYYGDVMAGFIYEIAYSDYIRSNHLK